jgi:hypothetical protein
MIRDHGTERLGISLVMVASGRRAWRAHRAGAARRGV